MLWSAANLRDVYDKRPSGFLPPLKKNTEHAALSNKIVVIKHRQYPTRNINFQQQYYCTVHRWCVSEIKVPVMKYKRWRSPILLV